MCRDSVSLGDMGAQHPTKFSDQPAWSAFVREFTARIHWWDIGYCQSVLGAMSRWQTGKAAQRTNCTHAASLFGAAVTSRFASCSIAARMRVHERRRGALPRVTL